MYNQEIAEKQVIVLNNFYLHDQHAKIQNHSFRNEIYHYLHLLKEIYDQN